jgi:hypothetical protein
MGGFLEEVKDKLLQMAEIVEKHRIGAAYVHDNLVFGVQQEILGGGVVFYIVPIQNPQIKLFEADYYGGDVTIYKVLLNIEKLRKIVNSAWMALRFYIEEEEGEKDGEGEG